MHGFISSVPGDGKTHYIKEQLQSGPTQLIIAVNEAFTPLKAISKLCSLPLYCWNVSIFFNFTMLSPGVRQLLYISHLASYVHIAQLVLTESIVSFSAIRLNGCMFCGLMCGLF